MTTGYIYIMSNSSFEGLVKIGRSVKDPAKFRVKELYDTGVPEPFRCEYWALVDDHEKEEKKAHRLLLKHRPNRSREYFKLTIPSAINYLRASLPILADKVFFEGPVNPLPSEISKRSRPTIISNSSESLKRVSWDEFIEKLKIYKKEYGDLLIHDGFKKTLYGNLGNQVQRVRQLYSESKIPEPILSELLSIGFIVDSEEAWTISFRKVKNLASEKNLNFMKRHEGKGFNAAGFFRDQFSKEQKGLLESSKKSLLESVGFNFGKKREIKPQGISDGKWWKGFDYLETYFERHGHTRVPITTEIGDVKLGRWVADMRAAKKSGKLSDQQISDLNLLNFVWDMNEYRYQIGLEKYKKHISEGGDPDPHQHSITISGFALGSWVNARKAEWKGQRGTMSKERETELRELGFPFE